MTSLADQIGMIEGERNRLRHEVERLTNRLTMQKGAIEEGRAERDMLRVIVQRQATLIGRYQSYFSTLHHGVKDLEAAKANAQEMPTEVIDSAAHVATIKERIARLVKSNGAAA